MSERIGEVEHGAGVAGMLKMQETRGAANRDQDYKQSSVTLASRGALKSEASYSGQRTVERLSRRSSVVARGAQFPAQPRLLGHRRPPGRGPDLRSRSGTQARAHVHLGPLPTASVHGTVSAWSALRP